MFSRRRGFRSVAGILVDATIQLVTCRCTTWISVLRRVTVRRLRALGHQTKKRVMGRNFENRKNAIFKTAGQKSKLYSKYGKQLYVVAKNGVPDPDANPALRSMIEKAKREQVPAHVMEKAMEKARGAGGEDLASA